MAKAQELQEKKRKLAALLAEADRLAGGDPAGERYARHREDAGRRSRAKSLAGRDVSGWVHPPAQPERRARALTDFRFFCEAYFPETFYLPWSPDHLRVIARIEQAVLQGGLFAVAMPRGSGKTALSIRACIWAALAGLRDFVVLVGASEDHAEKLISAIKVELRHNDTLDEDFSEVTGPVRALEGIASRCRGQVHTLGPSGRPEPTHLVWTAQEIVLPSIPGSLASGAIMRVTGITASMRGMQYSRPDGKTTRPSLCIIDDPQTRDSARSLSQCAEREAIIRGDVLGMAGPKKRIAAIMPCTIIRTGDLADRLLDRQKNPQWQGERTQAVYAWPVEEKLWEQYREVRAECFRQQKPTQEATELYQANRERMDLGFSVAWPERFNEDELSAQQHLMNLRADLGDAAFFAEFQNEPLPEIGGEREELTADMIAGKVNRLGRGEAPLAATRVTVGIDIQEKLLYYLVAAWSDNFTGWVLDYGTYPDQRRGYFSLRDARHTLKVAAPGTGLEGSIYAGLDKLSAQVLGREWRREDGALLKAERCLVDANWGASTNVVYDFCKRSGFSVVLTPSHGKGVTASSRPFNEYKPKLGDRVGLNWRILAAPGRRVIRRCFMDANFWKSFVHNRLAVALGDTGCLSLYGEKAETHRLFAEHLTAEYRVLPKDPKGHVVEEWKARPDKRDNHWFDCLVLAAVAASIQGATLPEGGGRPPPKRQRVPLAEMKRRAEERRRGR